MPKIQKVFDNAFNDVDMDLDLIPRLDLYMDQILTLFEEGLSENKRNPDEKIITKTMVNNYSKEKLILPVKGKKYSRTQILQLLCILNLKQNLSLADIKPLIACEDEEDLQACEESLEEAYEKSVLIKEDLKDRMQDLLREMLGDDISLKNKQDALTLALAMSSASTYLRHVCEEIVDIVVAREEENKESL